MEFSNADKLNNKNGQITSVNARSLSFTGVKPTPATTAKTSLPAERAGINPPATTNARTNPSDEHVGHKLELDPERAMSMTGVRDVPVFTDKNITIRLANETLLVTGQNLAVKTLDVENGKLQVTGRVFSLRYTTQTAPTSVIKRIFK